MSTPSLALYRAPMIRQAARTAGTLILTAATVLSVAPPAAAQGDPVVAWNAFADNASAVVGHPVIRTRMMAMVQVAVHDALNAVEPRYRQYATVAAAPPGASPAAAVAQATYVVLIAVLPNPVPGLQDLYDARLAAISCPSAYPACLADGLAAGQAAGDAIVQLRAGDGTATPHLPYTEAPGPGVYEPTPPESGAPAFAGWALVTPYALRSGSQFRLDPSPLFDLNSKEYIRDFREVKRVGRFDAEENHKRTPDQSEIARFWPPASNFNAVGRTIVAGRTLDTWELGRLFALINMAQMDAFIAVFDTKYAYNFWRPTTAIRAAATDGNPATAADPEWRSYLATPPYPDFPCGLTTGVGAATGTLQLFFGTDHVPFTFTAAGATRSFARLSDAAAEAVDARVFGGMHFRTGCEQGAKLGKRVARFVFSHELKPIKPAKD